MIPHKSRKYRAILDLSFRLRLKNGGVVPYVNEATTLEAPAAAIDQKGHALSCIIHAFAEAGKDDKVFMAKFDIKDTFWRMDCAEGKLQPGYHMALFNANSPTVSWVRKMAAKGSKVADQLLRALTLRMRQRHISPLTPLYIPGKKNAMTDIPSRSFGSEAKRHCETDKELLTLFNSYFPLQNQSSWTVYRPSSGITSRIMSALQREVLKMGEWRRLPRPGKHIGEIGVVLPICGIGPSLTENKSLRAHLGSPHLHRNAPSWQVR
jgi:hypothetical protein